MKNILLCFGHFGPREYDDALMDEYARVLSAWVAEIQEKRGELDSDEAVIEHFMDETDMADAWSARKARAEERLNIRGVLAYLDQNS